MPYTKPYIIFFLDAIGNSIGNIWFNTTTTTDAIANCEHDSILSSLIFLNYVDSPWLQQRATVSMLLHKTARHRSQ